MSRVVGPWEAASTLALTAALTGYAAYILLSGPAPRHPVQTGRMLAALDADGSGWLEAHELDGRDPPGRSWREHDLDQDGRLGPRELEIALETLDPRWLLPVLE